MAPDSLYWFNPHGKQAPGSAVLPLVPENDQLHGSTRGRFDGSCPCKQSLPSVLLNLFFDPAECTLFQA